MQQPNDNYINKLIEMVNTSPFPHHLRMQLVSISVDQAMVKLKTEQCHLQPFGIVHGGVLATLIDTATFWSVFLRLPEDVGLVNIDLKLNYLKSISTGLMTAEGRCIRAGLDHANHDLAARITGSRDIEFFAVDQPIVAIKHCRRADVPGIGRRQARFGHCKRRTDLAIEKGF